MPIIGELTDFYREEGIEICTGLALRYADGHPGAPFTWFCKDGESMTEHLGIAPEEVYFLEHLFVAFKPKRVLIIGNGMGWGTLAIGMLMPKGKVVALDKAPNAVTREGLALTNRIAQNYNLSVRAVQGISPQDVASVVDAELNGPVDFAFIDGLHTNEQVVLDYKAVREKSAPDAVFLFHDVAMCGLYAGMEEIERLAGLSPRLILSMPSGMAILFDEKRHPALASMVRAFMPSDSSIAVARQVK
jgi:predicted O-methyltransferase YrrM